VITLTDANFTTETSGSIPILVDFWAPWCAPCKALTPTLEDMSRDYAGRVNFGKVNIDETSLAQSLGIMSVPTLLLYKNGQVLGQLVGNSPKAKIQALLEKAL